jgi:hypothetical protein
MTATATRSRTTTTPRSSDDIRRRIAETTTQRAEAERALASVKRQQAEAMAAGDTATASRLRSQRVSAAEDLEALGDVLALLETQLAEALDREARNRQAAATARYHAAREAAAAELQRFRETLRREAATVLAAWRRYEALVARENGAYRAHAGPDVRIHPSGEFLGYVELARQLGAYTTADAIDAATAALDADTPATPAEARAA